MKTRSNTNNSRRKLEIEGESAPSGCGMTEDNHERLNNCAHIYSNVSVPTVLGIHMGRRSPNQPRQAIVQAPSTSGTRITFFAKSNARILSYCVQKNKA